ncbi:MAG: hypothetical protein M0Z53_14780 [Thermaerobacter sp.]|nr:hypothetical protein [Thermaerobacter sp.]
MIRIAISPEDLAIRQAERYTHPHPRVQRKRPTIYWVASATRATTWRA